MAARFENIDDYVASLPEHARVVVEEVRRRIHQVAPTATETISYQMPTLVLDGRRLVHFAGGSTTSASIRHRQRATTRTSSGHSLPIAATRARRSSPTSTRCRTTSSNAPSSMLIEQRSAESG